MFVVAFKSRRLRAQSGEEVAGEVVARKKSPPSGGRCVDGEGRNRRGARSAASVGSSFPTALTGGLLGKLSTMPATNGVRKSSKVVVEVESTSGQSKLTMVESSEAHRVVAGEKVTHFKWQWLQIYQEDEAARHELDARPTQGDFQDHM